MEFQSCRISLSQGEKSLGVRLLSSSRLPAKVEDEAQLQVWMGRWKYFAWGKYHTDDDSYFVTGSEHNNRAYWVFHFLTRQLRFVDLGGPGTGMIGGGLKHGQVLADPQENVLLYNATYSSRGIEPADAHGTGRGRVERSVAGFVKGDVSWEWVVPR